MNILLTALSLVALLGCFFAVTRSQREADRAQDYRDAAETVALKLKSERDRTTVLEREVDAVRRELRKLSGKFYATLQEDNLPSTMERRRHGSWNALRGGPLVDEQQMELCENWAASQTLGPSSSAAACERAYCNGKRAERELARRELLPRTVQGQAELAKLNAGKP